MAEGDADGVRRRKLVPKSRVLRVDRDGPVAHTEIRHTLVLIFKNFKVLMLEK